MLDAGTHWLSAGLATFGQVVPRGTTYTGLRVGNLATQNDVKSWWDDGSVKFVILTATIPTTGYYTLNPGNPATGNFAVTVPDVVVQFDIGANTFYATLPTTFSSFNTWLAGPQVREGRRVVTPVSTTDQNHAFLRVYYDLRVYRGGEFRVDVAVENTFDRPNAGRYTYDVTLWVNGVAQFARNNVAHHYLTRWRHVVTGFNPSASEIVPDFEPAYQAAALPRYLSIVTNHVNTPGGPTFEILGPGGLNPFMPDHSGRPEIAPYPDWAARYFVHKDPTQRAYVLAHGDLAGSWPIHVREVGGALVSIDERPNYWLDPRALPENRPAGNLDMRGPLVPDNAHQPSLAYIPYLLTGDRYYADEMALWANYVLIVTWQDEYYNARGGSLGLLQSNEVRGIGWGLRNIVDAAAYLPDSWAVKYYFIDKVFNNLAWLDDYALGHKNPLNVLWDNNRPENSQPGWNDRAWIALWEQDYVAWSIDHANKQGFSGGLIHRDRIGQFHLSLFLYPPTLDGAAPYVMPVGDQVPAGSGNIDYYTTYEELYYGPSQFAGYYGPEARLVAMIGVENGWEGADLAYWFLHQVVAVYVHDQGVPDVALRAGWALSWDGDTAPGAPGSRIREAGALSIAARGGLGWFAVQGLSEAGARADVVAPPADQLMVDAEFPQGVLLERAVSTRASEAGAAPLGDRQAMLAADRLWENAAAFTWPSDLI